MAENVLYADLNLSESTRPRILTVPDDPGSGCTYAEVKVKAQDTNAATNCKSSGKSRCSRKHVAILVVIILILVLAVCLIIKYGPTAGSQKGSTTSSLTNQEDTTTTLSHIPERAPGCPTAWKKHGKKCYVFSPEKKAMDWNASRAECSTMGSQLVVIDSKEELRYLLSQTRHNYYLLGLKYSPEELKWKWINNVEHNPAMFHIIGPYHDYHCTVIGYGEVQTAPCGGSTTTQNMCEKAATISDRHL